MEQLFREFNRYVKERQFRELAKLRVEVPVRFNWVRDVFENIHISDSPDSAALIWTDGDNELRYSFSEMGQQANRLLNLLRNNKIKQGDVLFSIIPLLPANWMIYLAAMKGGFRLVPAAMQFNLDDIVYRFQCLMPQVVVCTLENTSRIDEAEKLVDQKIALKIVIDGEADGWLSFNAIYTQSDTAEAADTRPNDPLMYFFTSGTTGMPKVVVHNHLNYAIGHLTTASWIGFTRGDIHYNISAPGWAKFAWSNFFAPWNVGATVFSFHPDKKFSPADHLRLMAKYRVTTFCAPPTVWRMLINEDIQSSHLLLKECVSAGEPLNPEVINTWKNKTGITIRDGYGQTETSCLIANLPGDTVKAGSMGKPTFLYEVIVADEDGNESATGEAGFITVRMTSDKVNGVFSDYHGNRALMKTVFRHGLYYTGDKAYRDEEGYVWFVGRDDDVIKSSDYRIGPFEIENVLQSHECILESAVAGSPHQQRGEVVKAFIVLNADFLPSQDLANDIFKFAKKHLAPYKIPRIIQFVSELPKTVSGKTKRSELKKGEFAKHNTLIPQEYFYA